MKTVVISSIKRSQVGGMFTNFAISLRAPLCSCYPMVTMDVFYGNRCDSMVVRCRFAECGEGGWSMEHCQLDLSASDLNLGNPLDGYDYYIYISYMIHNS